MYVCMYVPVFKRLNSKKSLPVLRVVINLAVNCGFGQIIVYWGGFSCIFKQGQMAHLNSPHFSPYVNLYCII